MSGERRTLLDKLWDEHKILSVPGGADLLHVDRFFLHDLTGIVTLPQMRKKGRPVLFPELNFAVTDHAVSSSPDRDSDVSPSAVKFVHGMRKEVAATRLHHFDVGDENQGIVHVIGPELGLTLPGATVLCTDSHTCTHGAVGALAWGVGSTDAEHILASQTIVATKPRAMRATFHGVRRAGVSAKDLVLALIGKYGSGAATGAAVEFAGPAISAMSMEERLTVCNMSVELGAKTGLMVPDATTFSYLSGRRFAPRGDLLRKAQSHWERYFSDEGASFDSELSLDVATVSPKVTWGTSVDQVVDIDALVPDPETLHDPKARNAAVEALRYMGLEAGMPLEGLPIQHVFIGSCTNGRLGDLREAARIVRGRHVAAGVRAWVVPGSTQVQREAERESIHRVFLDAGFEWRSSGCSLCSAANGEIVPRGERAVSTSNRNYVGRQGVGARTHLASPAVAAASAIAGRIADPRSMCA